MNARPATVVCSLTPAANGPVLRQLTPGDRAVVVRALADAVLAELRGDSQPMAGSPAGTNHRAKVLS